MKLRKGFKKLTALVMVLVMALAMSMTAWAAGDGTQGNPFIGEGDLESAHDGSITIHKYDIAAWEKYIKENPPAGKEEGFVIKYYGNSAAGTELDQNSEVGHYYLNEADEAAGDNKQPVYLGDLEMISNITFHLQSAVVSAGKEGSADVADYTTTNDVDSYGKTELGIMRWTNVPKGYYIITELENETTEDVVDPFVISMPMLDPAHEGLGAPQELTDIHVYPKNNKKEGPNIEKEITSNYENGNIVSWLVTAEVPDDIGTSKRYRITDIFSKGLDFVEDSLTVYYLDGSNVKVLLAEVDDYEVTVSTESDGRTKLVINVTDDGREKLAGLGVDTIYLTYDTVVNLSPAEWEKLAGEAVNNDIILEFINEDDNDFEGGPGPVDVKDFGGLEITKLDGATGDPLQGVVFKIYESLNAGGTDVDPSSVLKDKDGNEVELVTNEDGFAYYYGLGAGTYYLVEVSTIEDYKLLSGYKAFEINAQMAENHDAFTMEILNYLDSGITLPQTGGMGTFLFTAVGILLIAAAGGVYLISRKRKKSE